MQAAPRPAVDPLLARFAPEQERQRTVAIVSGRIGGVCAALKLAGGGSLRQQEQKRDPWGKNNRQPSGKSPLDDLLKQARKLLGTPGQMSRNILTGIIVLLVVGLLLSSYTIIEARQPQPIEMVSKVDAARVRSVNDKITLLTRDQNVIAVDFTVQYQVDDAQVDDAWAFFFENDWTVTVQAAAERPRPCPVAPTLVAKARDTLQQTLDVYNAGMKVTDISFQSVAPPKEVKDAFDDVNNAREDKQSSENAAQAYASKVLPVARGDASQIAAEAEGYKAERIARAQGDTARFNLILKEYKAAPEVTRRRIYLETMEQVMANSPKVIDGSDGHNVINLPVPRSDAGTSTVVTSVTRGWPRESIGIPSTRLALLIVLGLNSFYVIKEGHTAVVLQFGRIVRSDEKPGLHVKLPLVQQVVSFDSRILSLDSTPQAYFTSGKKSVNVTFYVKWRIADLRAFYGASPFNTHTLDQIIANDSVDMTQQSRIVADAAARKTLAHAATSQHRRIGAPRAPTLINAARVRMRAMRAEQVQIANELRSAGQEAKTRLQADADQQVVVLKSDAERDAEKVRGDGDAQAAAIYAESYGQDPEFYSFYRSMIAYSTAFKSAKGVLVLKPNSDFLRYVSDPSPKH
ncbi:MAG: hypothetical protein WDW38_003487 [Sanguina aurantia]